MSRKSIALIGGGGFIGHNLALKLNRDGHDVTVLDGFTVNNLVAFSSNINELENRDLYWKMLTKRLDLMRAAGIRILSVDARDYHKLSQCLSSVRPDVVVMLAAVAHADRSNKDPYSTFDHSLRTLENALDFSRGTVERFVYFSSSMVYGNFEQGKVNEDSICNPIGIYGALKFAGEKIVIAYNQVFKTPYVIIRPSALYGERCVSRRVGQIFIENAMRGRKIVVSGSGADRLDFTYIDDLVQGVDLAISHKNALNDVFNITYGDSRSIAQMTEILKSEFRDIDIEFTPKDVLMPDRGTLSVDKAKRILGYAPSNPLEVGFRKYISWYREFWKNENILS